MKPFLNEEFLLQTPTAQRLYHEYAEGLPIIDYHCHISPKEIAEDLRYDNLAQAMLGGDHYKWRLMRACGVDEARITGDADPYDKFLAFAEILPRCVGNPVYHWTHLELKRYFHCELPLSRSSAPAVWEQCNAILRSTLTVREMIHQANVTDIVTTDDPADDLRWHEALAADKALTVRVRPAWRPEKAIHIDWPGFGAYMERLGRPRTMAALRAVLAERMDFFDAHGCLSSDHGITSLTRAPATEDALNTILQKGLDGQPVSDGEAQAYQYAMLTFLGEEYARRDWAMELHFGVSRNNNSACFAALGPDTGFDAIASSIDVSGLPDFLDGLCAKGALPNTVLFSLDPNHNAMLNSLCGCFQKAGRRGAVQQGTAWWFNDSKPGMEAQMTAMMSTTALGSFLGMLTDSRSFLSYTRHEYFRRVLCNLLGNLVENGEYPADFDALGSIVQDVCLNNTRSFFGFDRK